MKIHLIDGTYELFRHFFGAPSVLDAEGRERGAVVGVLASMLGLIESGATELNLSFDTFRASLLTRAATTPVFRIAAFGTFDESTQAFSALTVTVILD